MLLGCQILEKLFYENPPLFVVLAVFINIHRPEKNGDTVQSRIKVYFLILMSEWTKLIMNRGTCHTFLDQNVPSNLTLSSLLYYHFRASPRWNQYCQKCECLNAKTVINLPSG